LEPIFEAISRLKFPDEGWHVVVVDDGSTDSTPQILRNWKERIPLTVLTHESNQGLGRAMRTGLGYLIETIKEGDAVVTMDSDNTHPPELALKMREKQKKEDLDVVIASRYAREGKEHGEEIGLAEHRKILSKGAGILLHTAFHIKGARDYTCGFRMYSWRILKRAQQVYGDELVEESSFVCMVEILVKLARIGARVGEVPLKLRYDLKKGASKMKVVRTIMRYFGFIWQYRFGGKLSRFFPRSQKA